MLTEFSFYTGWIVFDLIVLTLFFCVNKKIKSGQRNAIFIIFFIICLFLGTVGNAITPDYIPYKNIVKTVATERYPFTHIEPIYITFIKFIGNNYSLYNSTIIIFTLITYLFIFILNKKNTFLQLLLFSILCLYSVIGGRYYLFIGIMINGLILFVRRHRIMGIICLMIATILHKSAILIIPIGLMCLYNTDFYSRELKKSLVIIILLSTLAILLVPLIIEWYFGELSDIEKIYLNMEKRSHAGSPWWIFISMYQKTFSIMTAGLCLFCLRKRYIHMTLVYKLMYRMVFCFTSASIIVSTIGFSGDTISQRIMEVANVCVCILFPLCWDRLKKSYQYAYIFGIFIYIISLNAYITGVSHGTLQ